MGDEHNSGVSEPVTKCVGTSIDPLVLMSFDRTTMINDPQYTLTEAINDNTNDSSNMNGATAAAATYKAGVEDFVTDVTVEKEDTSKNGRSANQAAAEDNNNNISTTDTINRFRSLPFPREEVDDSDNATNHERFGDSDNEINHEKNGANDLILLESVSHDGGNHDDDSVARIIVVSGTVSDTDTNTNTKTNTDSNASTNTNRDRNTHNDTNNDVLYNDKNYSTNAPSFQRPGQSDHGDDSNKDDMISDDGKTGNFADDINKVRILLSLFMPIVLNIVHRIH